MSTPKEETPIQQFISLQEELGRNAELHDQVGRAISKRAVKLGEVAIAASDKRLEELIQSSDLIAVHREICYEIGQNILASTDWTELNRLEAISGDLISDMLHDERDSLAEEASAPVLSKLGMQEGTLTRAMSFRVPEKINPTETNHEDSTIDEEVGSTKSDKADEPLVVSEAAHARTKPDSNPEANNTRKDVLATIDYEEGAVYFGKNKPSRRRPYNLSSDTDDVSAVDRARLLTALSEHPKEDIRIRELWHASFGDRTFDRIEMRKHREWLLELTFNHQPIIEHNGKRGLASSYSMPRHELHIQHTNTRPDDLTVENQQQKPNDPEPVNSSPVQEGQDNQKIDESKNVDTNTEESRVSDTFLDKWISSLAQGPKKGPKKKSTSPEDHEISPQKPRYDHKEDEATSSEKLTISHGAYYSLARTIAKRSIFFRSLDLPHFDTEIVDLYESYAEENNISLELPMTGKKHNGGANDEDTERLNKLTVERIEKLSEMLNRDDILDIIDLEDESDPLRALIDYVTQLDETQLKNLKNAIQGRQALEVLDVPIVSGRQDVSNPEAYKHTLMLPDGSVLHQDQVEMDDESSPISEDRTRPKHEQPEESSHIMPANEDLQAEGPDTPDSDDSSDADRYADIDWMTDEPSVESSVEGAGTLEETIATIIENEIAPALKELGVDDISDRARQLSPRQIHAKFKVDYPHLNKMSGNGRISRKNKNAGLSIKDTIRTILWADPRLKHEFETSQGRAALKRAVNAAIAIQE